MSTNLSLWAGSGTSDVLAHAVATAIRGSALFPGLAVLVSVVAGRDTSSPWRATM
jgi:hypothetical protein